MDSSCWYRGKKSPLRCKATDIPITQVPVGDRHGRSQR
jgi:hypothetical protein